MRKLLSILTLLPGLLSAQQFYVGDGALVHIQEEATLQIGGDLENAGALQNLGTLSLYGNWLVNNNFNGLEGTLEFLGGSNQTISLPQLTIRELTINSGGDVTFPGIEYQVTDRLEFKFGNIKTGADTRFVLGENARVIGGSNDSYFEGRLISKGSGIKRFPVGANGIHAPFSLLDVFGVDTEIAVSYDDEHDIDPIPGDTLLGISHLGLWQVELLEGTTNPTTVQLEFSGSDLSDFRIRNNIRHKVNSPVVTFSNQVGGTFGSLGVSELIDTDSLTYGTITSALPVSQTAGQTLYFALGLAPSRPNELLFYIPQAFSPTASDAANRTFRIFGENISNEDFSLEIYNKLGVLVYATTSFEEANKNGWDGTNRVTGSEEPNGLYYYAIRLKFVTETVIERNGAFYLVK